MIDDYFRSCFGPNVKNLTDSVRFGNHIVVLPKRHQLPLKSFELLHAQIVF